MKLSIIIVNYNVKYFLEQALQAVSKACQKVDAEVFVVDNNSVDGSVELVREKFQWVKLIANKDNKGFSSANNQAIREAKGEYILLLNPDTIVEEDTFSKIVAFMDSHPEAGGLGVKMLDGAGKFLPESKRGLPTPLVAFYKIFGLSALFPKSKIFGKYHLGFLDKDETHEVDILSGAFMLLRKSVLDKIGLLDESFFMYGEDIDLSYRVILGGYKNYYFPETRIIHYKGESTKKSSVNYVFVFYNAMIIFAKKHFSQNNARLFTLLIQIAVYLRAGMAIISRFVKKAYLPLLDAVILFSGMYFMKSLWEAHVKNVENIHYPAEFLYYAVPAYIFAWLTSIYFSGGYDKPIKPFKIARGVISGTILILVVYALLPETLRFSRALILLGAGFALISLVGTRVLLNLTGIKEFVFDKQTRKRVVIVGAQEEGNRVLSLMKLSDVPMHFIGFVEVNNTEFSHDEYLGHLGQLNDLLEVYKIDEVIFCAKDISAQQIIDKMSSLTSSKVEYKIAPPESLYIIGSNSIDNNGELYVYEINSITKPVNKRNKRIIDIAVSSFLLGTLPLGMLITRSFAGLVKNILLVLSGKYSWVGYSEQQSVHGLPKIKRGVLTPVDAFRNRALEENMINRLNILYAKDYKVYNDLKIVIFSMKNLGKRRNLPL